MIHTPVLPSRRIASVPAACAALLLLTFGAPPARADGGLYVGANLGDTLGTYRRSDINGGVIAAFAAIGDTLVLSDSLVRNARRPWSVDVGYRFSPNFGLEASYIELGTLEYGAEGKETTFFGGSSPISESINIKSRGPALALVGVLPMTNAFNLEAQLGAYEGKTITSVVSGGSGGTSSGSDSKASASLLATVGFQYVIAGHWVLRLDYTYLNGLGEKVLGKSFNVDLLTGGVTYAF